MTDLQYITSVIDRGGPRGVAEMQQTIVALRGLAAYVERLEAGAEQGLSAEESAELESTIKTLEEMNAKLALQVEEKTKEARSLKSTVTRLKKKVSDESDS